jgi:hypothetical protein
VTYNRKDTSLLKIWPFFINYESVNFL